jgi:hypothetical protein
MYNLFQSTFLIRILLINLTLPTNQQGNRILLLTQTKQIFQILNCLTYLKHSTIILDIQNGFQILFNLFFKRVII